ncbi:MAG: phage tail tape measure protein [Pseudolabrys sp.]|jgi:hypothetical protein
MIEARAVISGEEKLSPLLDKVAKKFEQVQKSAKTAGDVDKMAASLAKVNKQVEAMNKFDAARSGFAKARTEYRAAQQEVDRAARAMKNAEGPARDLERAYQRAQNAVKSSARAFEMQTTAVLAAKRALEQNGIPINQAVAHQQRLAAAVDRTSAALDRQNKRAARRANVAQNAAIGLGMLGLGYRAKSFAGKAITSAAEMDKATRLQRVYTDISPETQANILTLQAKQIGQETPYSNLDVVKAQTAAMQGLPATMTPNMKAEIASAMLENVKHFAVLMEVDLKDAAEGVRTYLQTTNKDISTKAKATAESRKAVNQIIKMAKLGGMTGEDAQSFFRFAAGANTVVGVSPEAMMAIGALAKRGGMGGDEAGTFMRQVAGKLAAPTKKGLTAMRAAGVNYSDYIHMPAALDVGRMENQFQQDMGVSFTPAVRAALQKALNDKKILGDRSAFTEAVTTATEPLFPRTKKGEVSAVNKAKVAKSAGAFYQASVQSVDAEKLLDKLLMSDMSLAQINSIFDYRQGSRFAVTQNQRADYVAAKRQIGAAGDDPDFAKRKFDEVAGGFGYSLENLKGSFENLTLSIGQANEGLLKFGFDTLGHGFDWISNLSDAGRQAATALGAITAVGSGGFIMKQLFTGFGLSGSAFALDGAAAALTKAALALEGKGAASAAPAVTTPAISGLASVIPGASVGLQLYKFQQEAEEKTKTLPHVGWDEWWRLTKKNYGVDSIFGADVFGDGRTGASRLGSGDRPPVEATLKGSAEVTGKAEVVITIPGLSNSWTVQVPMRGTVDANGPGSLGTSSPDAAPQGRN